MRYRFRGLIRDNANPVEGHVESPTEQDAYNALSENGIVTEALYADPKPLNLSNYEDPRVSNAIDSALDTSSQQVAFDQLMDRYRGKNVWVIDRDKIRSRVAQVVDAALASNGDSPDIQRIRQSVATAIQGVFSDDRNLARQRNAESIFGMRVTDDNAPPPQPLNIPSAAPGMTLGGATAPALDEQIQKLAAVIQQAEIVLASIASAARRVGSGGGGGPRRMVPTGPKKEAPNEVLLEIFKANVELQKAMTAAPPTPPAGDAKRQAG